MNRIFVKIDFVSDANDIVLVILQFPPDNNFLTTIMLSTVFLIACELFAHTDFDPVYQSTCLTVRSAVPFIMTVRTAT